MRIVCFFIHGIGTQDQNFSDPLKEGIHSKLKEMEKKCTDSNNEKNFSYTKDIDFESIYWANIASNEQANLYKNVYPDLYGENSFFKKVQDSVLQLAPIRSMSMQLIGDIVGYLGKFEEPIKRTVFKQMADKLEEQARKNDDFSIIIVAHSLGSVILHDLLSGFLNYNYDGFDSLAKKISVFTMGSPLSLFNLSRDGANLKPFRKWVNILHPRDPIAFPMENVFNNVKDVKLDGLSLTPITHSIYWENSKVHSIIAEEIVDHKKNTLEMVSVDFSKEPPPEVFQSLLNISANAGFSEYIDDFEVIPFNELFSTAKKIDLCFVYGGHWLNGKAQYIIKALMNPDTDVRVFMLSPDSPSLPGFSHHFSGISAAKIKEKITDATEQLKGMADKAHEAAGTTNQTGKLMIYHSLNIINHSFYRFDNVIYYTPRKLCSEKLDTIPIPTLVFRNTLKDNNFFCWLMRDLDNLSKNSHDSSLHFDSKNRPPIGSAANT